ncbi:hypothetical protein [Halomonas sp.]|uniref:hypothetical protein n=1 Tax=Halomonas sp. TaxID=1486246 RepID=UPI003567C665
MATLTFPEKFATQGDDNVRTGGYQVVYGLSGDDTLRADADSEYSFLAGGAGNDTYVAGRDSAITVADSGGFDTVVADGIGLYSNNTYARTVEGRHLLLQNTLTDQQLAITDWQDPARQIESFQLGGDTFSLAQIQSAVTSSSNFLGDVTVEQIAGEDLLPSGTSSDDLQALLVNIEAREAGQPSAQSAASEVVGQGDAFFISHEEDNTVNDINDRYDDRDDRYDDHYDWQEGPNSDDWFDSEGYLNRNPDVAAARIDPLEHFMNYGINEGRDPNDWFDVDWYLSQNTDVANAGINPVEHYSRYGWKEGRDPSAEFDTDAYLTANPDVEAVGINPLEHWLQYGQAEGRELG